MFYVIQENIFKNYHHHLLLEFMCKYDLGYEIIKFKPFTEDIDVQTKRKDIWCWGSNNLSIVAEKYDWKPGSMYNSNHDFEIYAPVFKNQLFNDEGIVISFTDKIPKEYNSFFARPTKDTKTFAGQIFEKDNWNKWVDESIDNKTAEQIVKETNILIAPLKSTVQEMRCFVVGGEVITISQYKSGERVSYLNLDGDNEIKSFAQSMTDLFQPAEAFVLDICRDEYNDLKVLEINCINNSGFYDADMNKLFTAIETHFN